MPLLVAVSVAVYVPSPLSVTDERVPRSVVSATVEPLLVRLLSFASLAWTVIVAASVPGGDYAPSVAHAAAKAGFATLFTSEPTIRWRSIEGLIVRGRPRGGWTGRGSPRPGRGR